MRPIWCPENFRESLSTLTTTFPEIFNGLLFRSIMRMCVQNLKFAALPVPGIIGVTKKLDSPWVRPRSLFSKFLNQLLLGWTLRMYRPNLKSVALLVPEVIAIEVLWVANRNLGEEEAVGGRGRYRSKELWWFPIGSSVLMRFRDIAAFVLQHAIYATFSHLTSIISPWNKENNTMILY